MGPDTRRGSSMEIRNTITQTLVRNLMEVCGSSAVPSTMSFTGRRPARRIGSQAERNATDTAMVNEITALSGEITAGISMPWDRDCPMP